MSNTIAPTAKQAGELVAEVLPASEQADQRPADAAGMIEPLVAEIPTADADSSIPSGPFLPFRDLLEGPPIPASAQADLFARWAGLLRGQGFSLRQVRQILWQVGQRRCVPPLSADAFEDLLTGGGETGLASTESVLAPGVDPADAEARREALMQPEAFPWNSLGNAKRLAQMYEGRIRYVQDEKGWLIWNGRFWQLDENMEIHRRYRQMVEAMFVVASLIPPGQTPGEERRLGRLRKDFIAWIHKSQSQKVEEDSIRQARAEASVSSSITDFDRNDDLLAVANGTLDLRSGLLRPHDPADRITRHIDILYDPAADCPQWKAFLLAIQDNDPAMVDYLQRCLGYSLTADVSEQCMFICKGDGSNGKSTMLGVVMEVLGPYAATTDRNLLVLSRRDHPTSIYGLRNIRLAVTSELEPEEYLSESLVKQMTGEREIQARRMGRDFARVPITWKIWLTTNHAPRIRGNDFGIRRRIRVIPFDVKFDAERDDKGLREKLLAERAGILTWLVVGGLAWLRSGLQPPDKILRATEALFDEQGRLEDFVHDCVRDCAGARISAEQFYAFYSVWCQRAGVAKHTMLNGTDFGERMARKYTRRKCHGIRVYQDIEIPVEVVRALRDPGVPALEFGDGQELAGTGPLAPVDIDNPSSGSRAGDDRRLAWPDFVDALPKGVDPNQRGPEIATLDAFIDRLRAQTAALCKL